MGNSAIRRLELVTWVLEVDVGGFVGNEVMVAWRDWLELYKAFLCIGIKVGLWTSLLHLRAKIKPVFFSAELVIKLVRKKIEKIKLV